MPATWTVKQYGDVVERFRDRECDSDAWDEALTNMAILIAKGPVNAGPNTAKKLKGGDGIWELRARHGNLQPRLLFYVDGNVLVFVHAFMKKGKKEYVQAINLAKDRRRAIQRGGAIAGGFRSTLPH